MTMERGSINHIVQSSGLRPIGYEAKCLKCGETFNPADGSDLTHLQREDGEECMGLGEMKGAWGNE